MTNPLHFSKPPKLLLCFLTALLGISIASVWWQGLSKTVIEKPVHWATRIEKKGLPNFFQVSDTLYRGAQPTQEGFLELKKMGIKTIVNLREFHSDEKFIEGMGFNYFQIPASTSKPVRAHYQKFLDIVKDPDLQPAFVHCHHGADRTGTAVALYRITVQGWATEETISELQQGGYGYHSMFKEIITFVRNFNNQP